MNCPNCGVFTLAKHCNENDKCPWYKCVTCKLDIAANGATMVHKVFPAGGA